MAVIARVRAREILDSRGRPTVEVDVWAGGARGRAGVPAGASTGRHEARELRDGDPARHRGRGVRRAVAAVNDVLGPALLGHDVADQAGIDRRLCDLDGTPDKSRFGANAILGVSLACAHAAAAVAGVPLYRHLGGRNEPLLPLPMVNLISGGLHAGRHLEFQDFLLLPAGATTFGGALEMTVAVYQALGEVLARRGFEAALVGDEGGYGPRLQSNRQAVELILEAITAAGYRPGTDAGIALDVASTHFYHGGRYRLEGQDLSGGQMVEFLRSWADQYPVWSVEDGLAEDDWDGWRLLTEALGRRVQLIGDDLFTTNPERVRRGVASGVANGVLVKLNQIGTLTETLAVVDLARQAGYAPIISARSGETEDTTIADLAVATAAGQIKIGCVVRGERLVKYNQLLRIEEELGDAARLARWSRRG